MMKTDSFIIRIETLAMKRNGCETEQEGWMWNSAG